MSSPLQCYDTYSSETVWRPDVDKLTLDAKSKLAIAYSNEILPGRTDLPARLFISSGICDPDRRYLMTFVYSTTYICINVATHVYVVSGHERSAPNFRPEKWRWDLHVYETL